VAPPPSVPIAMAPSLGAQLRDARREAGLTQYEVAEITRIRVGRLVEFEADDFSGCDTPVLARGRLDAIARAVGVDPAPLLAVYEAGHGASAPALPPIVPRGPDWGRPRTNWTRLLIGLLAVVALYPLALLLAMVLG